MISVFSFERMKVHACELAKKGNKERVPKSPLDNRENHKGTEKPSGGKTCDQEKTREDPMGFSAHSSQRNNF